MVSLESILLFAANDWWQFVGLIIFVILSGLGQLFNAREEAKKKKARQARPKPLAPRPEGQAAPANQADPLRAEVEEFLRRAQGKPAAEQARPAPLREQRPPRPVEPQARPIKQQPPRKPVNRPARKEQPPARKRLQPQTAQPIDLRRETVVEHVARHVSTDDIAERTSHLGEEVSLADENMAAHLEKAFSGEVGQLEHRERQVVDKGPTIAEEIRDLLSQPAGMRQLIVANEILRRPEDRW